MARQVAGPGRDDPPETAALMADLEEGPDSVGCGCCGAAPEAAAVRLDASSAKAVDRGFDVAARLAHKAGKQVGSWKSELCTESQPNVPEEYLHQVHWANVAVTFTTNLCVLGSLLAYLALLGLPSYFSLPLFTLNFLLTVIIGECAKTASFRTLSFLGVAAVAILVGGGLVTLHPILWLRSVARYITIPLLVVLLVLAHDLHDRTVHGSRFHSLFDSDCLQTLTGRRYAVLYGRLEFVKLMKALYYENVDRKTAAWRACVVSSSAKLYKVFVGMVSLDATNPDLPDITFSCTKGEFEPFEYMLVDLTRFRQGVSDRYLAVDQLERILKHSGSISDQVLDTFIDAADGDPIDSGSRDPLDVVHAFLAGTRFPPKDPADLLVAWMRRRDYLSGLWGHWAVRAVYTSVFAVILALPAIHVYLLIFDLRGSSCGYKPPYPRKIDIAGTPFCGTDGLQACRAVCSDVVDFFFAVRHVVGVSLIELNFALFLLPVFLFNEAVATEKRAHTRDELNFLQRLQEPKKAAREVISAKENLERVFRLPALYERFTGALLAWRGKDPAVAACGPITDAEFHLTTSQAINVCFKQVMRPISEIQCSISADSLPGTLAAGVAYRTAAEKEALETAWRLLKFRNDLGTATRRNYKALFDVYLSSEVAVQHFENWCNTKYFDKLQHICDPRNVNVQDSGTGSHLFDHTYLGDCLVPKGFSLTHVYVQSMPADGAPWQIELGGAQLQTGEAMTAQQCLAEFWNQFADLKKNMLAVSETNATPNINMRLERYPIVVRFSLSEQYYHGYLRSVKVPGDRVAEHNATSFSTFVDFCLTPVAAEGEYAVPTGVDAPPVGSKVCVFMGDEDTSTSLWHATKKLVTAISVYVECLAVVLIIPLLRLTHHKHFLPQPFTIWLACGMLFNWGMLSSFFSSFWASTTRLGLIASCLALLEKKTIQPSKLSKATGGGEATPRPEKEAPVVPAQAAVEEEPAFDLFVHEDPTQVKVYDPNDEFWQKEFRNKHDNVHNWLLTVSHLRVFVSTSRITAQSMLMAAVFVVACLMLLSFFQAMLGEGVVHVDAAKVIHAVKERAGKHIADAAADGDTALHRLIGQHRRLAAALLAAPAAHSGGGLGNATMAAELREALQPVYDSFKGVLRAQHAAVHAAHSRLVPGARAAARRRLDDEDAEDAQAAVQEELDKVKKMAGAVDFKKVTPTQIFTLAMALLVMGYTVPLMWNIVRVNGFFDTHEDLLLKQKRRHRLNHAKREAKRTGKWFGAGGEAPGDMECGRYERILEMTIETARKTRERFPFKLFGFVISTQLFATWIVMAASPVVDQAKQMMPGLTMLACENLENSPWLERLQRAIDASRRAAEEAAIQAAIAAEEVNGKLGDKGGSHTVEDLRAQYRIPHVRLHTLVHQNLCVPLGRLIGEKVDSALVAHGVDDGGEDEEEEEDKKADDKKDKKAEDEKAEDTKAEDEKAEDKKADDKKAQDKKAGDKKAEDKKAGDKKAEGKKAKHRQLRELPGLDLDGAWAVDPDDGGLDFGGRGLEPDTPAARGVRIPDLERIVVPWWIAHADQSAETKMLVVEMLMWDLCRAGTELLQTRPRRVLRTFGRHSLVGVWKAMSLLEEAWS